MRSQNFVASAYEIATMINKTHDFDEHLGVVGDIIKTVGFDPHSLEPFLASLENCGADKARVEKYRTMIWMMFRVGQPKTRSTAPLSALDAYREQYGKTIN
ncbi:MAG: hypothetical protein ACRDDY_13715 [Clostridium sp.]|uniref:hypothetical protein n=1 Tax=Clostridium sp. TaxID=1506 RepID=UPI003EE63ACB